MSDAKENQEKTPTSEKGPDNAPEKSGAEMSGLGSVVIRNEFYRDGYRSLLKVTLLLAVAVVGLIGAMYYVIQTNQPQHYYFATTEDGRLVPMVPLSQPNLSSPALMSWVAQSTTNVMTFGFNDYRRRLQESSRSFTKRGWESFTQALQRSRIIEKVEANQQIITASPKGAPILRSEGMVAGRYQWVVEVPLVLTYMSGAKRQNQSMLVTVVVVRVPRLESSNGIGIEQWISVAR